MTRTLVQEHVHQSLSLKSGVGDQQYPARGRRLRLYYSAQIGVSPPRLAIQVNDRRLVSRDWVFHLENQLREHYSWEGVPVIIDLVPKRSAIKARS